MTQTPEKKTQGSRNPRERGPRDRSRRERSPRDRGKKGNEPELIETVINVRRVSKVIKGGRRFSFSALVVVGDGAGSIGVALGKGRDVATAISKSFRRAKKVMFPVPMYKTTIPFNIIGKHGASSVVLRSAAKGTGVIAGGAVRAVMEALGVRDVLSKSIGSANPQNTVKATVNALQTLRSAKDLARMRGKTVQEIIGGEDVAAA